MAVTLSSSTYLFKNEKRLKEQVETTEDVYATFNRIEKDLNHYLFGFKSNESGGFDLVTLDPNVTPENEDSGQTAIRYAFLRSGESFMLHRYTKDRFLNNETWLDMPLIQLKQVLITYTDSYRKGEGTWKKDDESPAVIHINLTDMQNRVWKRSIPIMVRNGVR